MSGNGEAMFKESISNAQKILKGKKENFARLQREVINTGACVSCGACVASCLLVSAQYAESAIISAPEQLQHELSK